MPRIKDLTNEQHKRLSCGYEIWDGEIIVIQFKSMSVLQIEQQKDDIFKWLENNTTGKWKIVVNVSNKLVIQIEENDDIVMFKLTFQM